jgi:hypothetical protein
MMTRITITVPDPLGEQIKQAAGANVSGWMADLARTALLRQAALAAAEYDQAHPDDAWDAERLRSAS